MYWPGSSNPTGEQLEQAGLGRNPATDDEPLLLEAVDGRRLKLGDTHPHTLESWNNLIDLYEAWDKPEKAEEWRAKLPQTMTVEQ
ncbi:MAG: tetratricopeptide repeat protein [Planctomycetota bacterium]